MKLEIISLNIRRYFDWDKRKDLLIKFLKEKNPDIILLQETIFDPEYSINNQVQEIARILDYPYHIFSSAGLKYSQRGQTLIRPIQIGQGVLSKNEIINIENIFLEKDSQDKELRLLQNFSLRLEGEEIKFINIHFSNSDIWAEKHLKETLKLFEDRDEKRIMVGDFNLPS